ncbi:MAG: hypothetical protein ABI612_13490 [Betaproteobacteria bacterium]
MKERKRNSVLAGLLATLAVGERPLLKILGVVATCITLGGLSAHPTFAEEPAWQPIWQINAGSCIPDSRTAAEHIYMTATQGLRVKFIPGATGTIRLNCPISFSQAEDFSKPEDFPATARIRNILYVQDPDGRFDDYHVKGTFHTVWAGDGSISTQCSINSNDADSTAQWGQLSCDYFGGIAPGLRIYWLAVEIFAKETGRTVEFNGAAIWTLPPQ